MELNLTNEQKLQSLQAAEKTLALEIYNTLIRVGADPDSFDESEIESLRAPATEGEVMRLKQLISSINLVKEKITSLS
jgi:hypothetical protein